MSFPENMMPLQIDRKLATKARHLEVDVTKAAENGIKRAIRAAEASVWLEENMHALESSNTFVKSHGLPLSKLRLF